jgi:hypothetical protein
VYGQPQSPYQDPTGRPLSLAPKVTGAFGGTYKRELNDKYKISFDAHSQFSSSYYTSPELDALGIQSFWMTVDLALHLIRSDDMWDLALKCIDCNDNIHITYGLAATAVPGIPAGVIEDIARPRQIVLELTMHPKL